jgi:hypothetical protein
VPLTLTLSPAGRGDTLIDSTGHVALIPIESSISTVNELTLQPSRSQLDNHKHLFPLVIYLDHPDKPSDNVLSPGDHSFGHCTSLKKIYAKETQKILTEG